MTLLVERERKTAAKRRAVSSKNQKSCRRVNCFHRCKMGCKEGQHCHLADAKPGIGSVCDGTGAVHRAYGVRGEDWFYVIGPRETIDLSSPATRGAELAQQLKTRVDNLSDQRIAQSFAYSDQHYNP